MQGLPEMWLQSSDEVYSNLRGPGENLTILATAYADQKLKNASPHNEPMLLPCLSERPRISDDFGTRGGKDDAAFLPFAM